MLETFLEVLTKLVLLFLLMSRVSGKYVAVSTDFGSNPLTPTLSPAKEGINGFSSSTGATSGIITGVAEPSTAASEDRLPSSTHVDSTYVPPTNVGSTSATQETLGTGATGGSVPSDSHSSGLAPALGAFVESTPTTSAFSSKTEHGFPEAESIGTAIDAKPVEVVPVADEHQSRETGNPALPIEVLSAAGIAGAAGVAGAPISARTERASEDSGRGGTNNGSFASTEPASAIPGHMSGPGHITANDRANSTTSVTAIRHGEPGDLHNKNFRGAGIGLGDGLNDIEQKGELSVIDMIASSTDGPKYLPQICLLLLSQPLPIRPTPSTLYPRLQVMPAKESVLLTALMPFPPRRTRPPSTRNLTRTSRKSLQRLVMVPPVSLPALSLPSRPMPQRAPLSLACMVISENQAPARVVRRAGSSPR